MNQNSADKVTPGALQPPGRGAGAPSPRWDFFIAHAGEDSESAEDLYERLAPHAPTFLDSRCIELGDDWDRALARAQREALITVVLVSNRTEVAYYQREEIAAAIAMARAAEGARRVVPLFLQTDGEPVEAPYGLRLKHGLRLSEDFDLDDAAQALLDSRARLLAQGLTEPKAGVQPRRTPSLARRKLLWAGAGASAVALAGALTWLLQSPPAGPISGPPPITLAAPPAPSAASTPPTSTANCITVNHQSPNVIPHYLLNSFGSENFPYWLRLSVPNNCADDHHLTLRFERSNSIALIDPPQEEEFTVLNGKTLDRIFRPDFQQSGGLRSGTVSWSLESQSGDKLRTDSIRVEEIVDPFTIAWDLKKPGRVVGGVRSEGEPVEREFLYASLAAWTVKPPERVDQRARACRAVPGGGPLLEREDAIRACYNALFTGKDKVYVSDNAIRFPHGQRQRIVPPAQVIKDGTATALEAALLFAAILGAQHKDGIDPEPVLLMAPERAEDAALKIPMIAWSQAGRQWRAVDLRYANTKSFDDNVGDATTRAGALLNGDLADGLKSVGVTVGTTSAAIAVNLYRVPSEYRIRGLP